jgi:hypothetical protein
MYTYITHRIRRSTLPRVIATEYFGPVPVREGTG